MPRRRRPRGPRPDRPRPRRPQAQRPGRTRAAPRAGRSHPPAAVQAGQEVSGVAIDAARDARAPGRRRPRLPGAGGRLQGHHAAARRPRGVHRGGRGAGRGRARRVRQRPSSTRWSAWRRAGFILAAPVALALGRRLRAGAQGRQAAAGDVRRVLRPGVRRGHPRDAPRRARRRATGCCSSTTCWPPAAPSPRPCGWSSRPAATSHARRVLMELSFLPGREAIGDLPLTSLLTV